MRRVMRGTILAIQLVVMAACSSGQDTTQDLSPMPDGTTTLALEEVGEVHPSGPEIVTEPDLQPQEVVPEAIEEQYVPPKTVYPPPPYGSVPGTVIKDHKFLDPEKNLTVRLSDLYQHPEKKVLLLVSAAGWCPVCQQELQELMPVYTEYAPQGLEIWYTLFEDYKGNPPTLAFWKDWMIKLKPNFPNLLDTNFELGNYFFMEARPTNMVIRLDTMEIIYLQTGLDMIGILNKIKQVVGE